MKIGSMEASTISTTEPAIHTKEYRPIPNVQIDNEEFLPVTEAEKQQMPVSGKVLENAIEKANKALNYSKKELQLSVHPKTKDIMVKVIDSETKEVLREFPPEKILDMIAKMWEIAGLIVDERR